MDKNMLDKNIYEFEYQNYWGRALSLLPLIFFAALILSFFWQFTNQGQILFFLMSIVITFVIAYTLYRHIEAPFRHEGKMQFDEENIFIKLKRETVIKQQDITCIEMEEAKLYGVRFAILVITYIFEGKERRYCIYSTDLHDVQVEECSLWKCYQRLLSDCRS